MRTMALLTVVLGFGGTSNSLMSQQRNQAAAEPRLRVREELRIGSATDASTTFDFVLGARPLGDGAIAVLTRDPRGVELRVYEANGRHRWTRSFVGADMPFAIAAAGDTIAVLVGQDPEVGPLLLFRAGAPGVIATVTVPPNPAGRTAILVPASDGAILVAMHRWGVPGGRTMAPVEVQEFEFRRVNRDATLSAPVKLRADSTRPASASSWNEHPLRRARTGLAAANGRLFFLPIGASTIQVHTLEGGTEQVGTVTGAGVFGRLADESVATVSGLYAASSGGLAVVRTPRASTPGQAPDSVAVAVFDDSGRHRGTAILPPGTMVHAFTGTHLYGVVAGGGNAQAHVVRFRVE